MLAGVESGVWDAPRRGRYTYARRRPENGTLHRVVRENLQSFFAAVEQGYADVALPPFVKKELQKYVDCGILSRGFATLECVRCGDKRLVAFSCKARFCPSCLGRRMVQTAANLVDHVLPSTTPLRQFVVTFPFELRTRLAYDGRLLGAVTRIVVDSVLGWYRRRMRDTDGIVGKSGAVTVVQRVQADLRLNPHLHTIALDGVFAPRDDGELIFHALPELDSTDVADLLQVVRVRVLRFLERRGVIENADELIVLPDDLAEREPALAQLAAASVHGLPPAGPERRDRPRPPVALGGQLGVEMTARLAATELGFSLHAGTTAAADDSRGREALVRYALRPPIAQERLKLLDDGLVRIELRRPFKDGTVAVDLDPLSLLVRLAASIPPPRFNVVRYQGVLGPASKWRPLIVPQAAEESSSEDASQRKIIPAESNESDPLSKPSTHRSGWRPWAELMKRAFEIDVEKCDRCGGQMKLRAVVTKRESVERLLRHLGEPTDAPGLSPARDPPFWQSRVLRQRAEQASGQAELFS